MPDNVDSDNVSLNASESTSGTLSWTPDAADVGDWYAIVGSEDDSDNTQITVALGDATAQSATATASVSGTVVETGQTDQQAAAEQSAVARVVETDATAQAAAAAATIDSDREVQTGATAQAAAAALSIGQTTQTPAGSTDQSAVATATISDTIVERDTTTQAAVADAGVSPSQILFGGTSQSAAATATVGDGVSVQTGETMQQAAASMDVYDGFVGSTSQAATGSVSIGSEVITETDRTIQRAMADATVDDLVVFTAVDWEQTTPHIPEPDHVVKTGSDRPDFTFVLEHDGTPVDLPDAVDATVELYAPEGTQIDHGGELGGRYPAVVSYDVDADLFVGGGWYTAEIRVTFSDGDEQWFPIERPTYDIAVYPSPYDRPETIAGDEPLGYTDSEYGTDPYGGT